MAVALKRFYGPARPGAAETTIYTAPAGKTLLREVVFSQNTGATVQVSLSIVPNGGAADGTHRIIDHVDVADKDPLVFSCWQVLAVGDFISVLCSSANVAVVASGIEGLP